MFWAGHVVLGGVIWHCNGSACLCMRPSHNQNIRCIHRGAGTQRAPVSRPAPVFRPAPRPQLIKKTMAGRKTPAMADLANVMARLSAAARGGEPPGGGHSQSHPRSKRDTLRSLQQTTRDRVRDDVSRVVSTTVVEDATLMKSLEIGSPSLEIQQRAETFLAQSAPPPAQVALVVAIGYR